MDEAITKEKEEQDDPVARSSIEDASDDDDDDAAQLCSLFKALSARKKRRTIDMISSMDASFFTSTMVEDKVEEEHVGASASPGSSTLAGKPSEATGGSATTLDMPSIATADGEVTLRAGESRVIIQTHASSAHRKLGKFSGITPIPPGQVNFKTWKRAAARLVKTMKEVEAINTIQNSLVQPALDLVQNQLDDGKPFCVLEFLEQVYGDAGDKHSLLKEFYDAVQNVKDRETPSSFLNSLYLLMDECRQVGAVSKSESMGMLLKQFNSGCMDETLLTKLRLEEQETSPPDFGTLLMAVRKEEAKRTRKQLLAKIGKSQQVQVPTDVITSELASLKQQVAHLQQQLSKKEEDPKVASSGADPKSLQAQVGSFETGD